MEGDRGGTRAAQNPMNRRIEHMFVLLQFVREQCNMIDRLAGMVLREADSLTGTVEQDILYIRSLNQLVKREADRIESELCWVLEEWIRQYARRRPSSTPPHL